MDIYAFRDRKIELIHIMETDKEVIDKKAYEFITKVPPKIKLGTYNKQVLIEEIDKHINSSKEEIELFKDAKKKIQATKLS